MGINGTAAIHAIGVPSTKYSYLSETERRSSIGIVVADQVYNFMNGFTPFVNRTFVNKRDTTQLKTE